MKLNLIAAISVDGAIGNDDTLLWYIKEDFKHYKNLTVGNICIVGLNTYFTLPHMALQRRTHIVVTGGDPRGMDIPPNTSNSSVYTAETLEDAIIKAEAFSFMDTRKIFFIGGAQLYNTVMNKDLADELDITWINKLYPDANKRFPIQKIFDNYILEDMHVEDTWSKSITGYLYKFCKYKRN